MIKGGDHAFRLAVIAEKLVNLQRSSRAGKTCYDGGGAIDECGGSYLESLIDEEGYSSCSVGFVGVFCKSRPYCGNLLKVTLTVSLCEGKEMIQDATAGCRWM
jgi:hypothetical protein